MNELAARLHGVFITFPWPLIAVVCKCITILIASRYSAVTAGAGHVVVSRKYGKGLGLHGNEDAEGRNHRHANDEPRHAPISMMDAVRFRAQ